MTSGVKTPEMTLLFRHGCPSFLRVKSRALTKAASQESLVIIHDLDPDGAGGTLGPFEANAPLVVDADTELPFPIASQRFEAIARQSGQIADRSGGLQAVELEARGTLDRRERLHSLAGSELSGALVPIADDHGLMIRFVTCYDKRNARRACLNAQFS